MENSLVDFIPLINSSERCAFLDPYQNVTHREYIPVRVHGVNNIERLVLVEDIQPLKGAQHNPKWFPLNWFQWKVKPCVLLSVNVDTELCQPEFYHKFLEFGRDDLGYTTFKYKEGE